MAGYRMWYSQAVFKPDRLEDCHVLVRLKIKKSFWGEILPLQCETNLHKLKKVVALYDLIVHQPEGSLALNHVEEQVTNKKVCYLSIIMVRLLHLFKWVSHLNAVRSIKGTVLNKSVGGLPLRAWLLFCMRVGPARVDWDGKLKSYKTKKVFSLNFVINLIGSLKKTHVQRKQDTGPKSWRTTSPFLSLLL